MQQPRIFGAVFVKILYIRKMLDENMVLILLAIWIAIFLLSLIQRQFFKILFINVLVAIAYIGLALLIFGIDGRESIYTYLILLLILGLHGIFLLCYISINIIRQSLE